MSPNDVPAHPNGLSATPVPPRVLIHGVGLDRQMWAPFLASSPHPAITYDLLGLGDAPKPPGPYTLAMYADQLDEVLTELLGKRGDRRLSPGLDNVLSSGRNNVLAIQSDTVGAGGNGDEAASEPVDLVGFSMGALVAQRFALDHPTRVRRLVLISGVFDRTAAQRESIGARVAQVANGGYLATIEPALQRWFTPAFAAARQDVIEAVRRRMAANEVGPYLEAYRVFATADSELARQIDQIAAPTLVITGEDDAGSTPAMTRALAAGLQHATAVVVPGQRHLLPIESPRLLAGIVDGFLSAEISATPGPAPGRRPARQPTQ